LAIYRSLRAIPIAVTQVADKLKQVQGLLVKTHARSVKDDKFTKIIKSFVASF
jgi:hypothetical protein